MAERARKFECSRETEGKTAPGLVTPMKVVHSSSHEEELMDHALIRFRQAANRENHRRPLRRRYPPQLQHQAVEYWHQHRGDDGVRAIAASLGVSVTTLQRWTRPSAGRPGFD